jgi:FkbM family methyltransferase|tara:strand:+ start:13079 stop:13888 length:810 start_codon:yes stop_codon:yes gene_type:complete
MNKIKNIIKNLIKNIFRIFFFKELLFLITRIVDNDFYKIPANGKNYFFAKSGKLNEYRIKTFITKEPETIDWINKFETNKIFWDIGANIGLYSLYASINSNSKVFSFEPSVFNLELLTRNINLNSQNKNISLIPLCLSHDNSISEFYCTSLEKSGALSSFKEEIDQNGNKLNSLFSYNTVGMSADDLIKIYSLKLPDYIKIDVDGHEHMILKGASNALKNCKSILIELSDSFKDQKFISNELLISHGFTLTNKFYKSDSNQSNQIWTKK